MNKSTVPEAAGSRDNAARSRVAVIGGGMVGAVAALCLEAQGFPVTVIDRRRPQRQQGRLGLDIRHVALSPGSRALLQSVDIWPTSTASAFRRMCVWEQWGTGVVRFDAAELGRQEMGWLVEASPLVLAAWARMAAAPGIEVLLAEIAGLEVSDDGVQVQFVDASSRTFDFVVAADGANSVAHQALDVSLSRDNLDQVAIATVIRTARTHAQTAWQCFLNEGPLALLPALDAQVCSVVWSQTAATAARRMQLDDAAFCGELERASEGRLGAIEAVDERFSFPLIQQRVRCSVPHPRVVLAGDALRVIHPLAGQGVNLGFDDVQALLRVATQHMDLTTPGIWRAYARQREAASQLMMHAMAALQKIYTTPEPTTALLRQLGIRSFNALGGLKRQVMRQAMGLDHLKQEGE